MTAKLVESLAGSTLLKDDDHEIIFIEEGKASRGEMLDYVETYGLEDMTVCPTTGLYGISIMYHYLDTWGSSTSVSNFPVIFVIDKDDLIRGMTDGIIYADSIASLCSKKCDTPVTDFPEPLPVLQTAKVNALCRQTEARSMLANLNAIRSGSEGELWYWNQDDERINIDGLQPLKYNYELEKIAMQRAVEQALLCDKKRPDEKCYHTIYNEFKIAGLPCGENIAVGCENVQEVIDEWWAEDAQYHNAQEYRRNILSLDSDSEYVGIAHVQVGGKNYWVAEFASDCPDSDATATCDSVKTFDIRYYRENVWDDDLSFPYDADYDLKWLNKLNLMVGDEYQIPNLSELINYDGSNRTGYITDMVSEWIVDDSSIAEVSGNIITAKAAGRTTITKAATFGGAPMVVTVNVIENSSSASDDNPGSGDQQTSGDNTSRKWQSGTASGRSAGRRWQKGRTAGCKPVY